MRNNETNINRRAVATGPSLKKKILLITSLVIVIVLVSISYYRYYFVFGEGVKAGQLNYFVEKGYLFKTHEGRLIQAGLRTQSPGSITSNEFMFSVTNSRLADTLNRHAGGNCSCIIKNICIRCLGGG